MIVGEQPGRNAGLRLSCHIFQAVGAEMAGSLLRARPRPMIVISIVRAYLIIWNTGRPVIVVIEQPLTVSLEEHAIQLQRICLHSDLGNKPSVGDAAMRTRVHNG